VKNCVAYTESCDQHKSLKISLSTKQAPSNNKTMNLSSSSLPVLKDFQLVKSSWLSKEVFDA